MGQNESTYDANAAFEKLTGLFRMPPLRKTEDLKTFRAVFAEFFKDLGPGGFVGEVIVYRIAIDTWHKFELMRDRMLLVEKRERERRNQIAVRNKKREIASGTKRIDEEFGYRDTPERSNAIKELYREADAIQSAEMHATVQDLDYAVVIEGYEYLDRIDRMIDRYSRRISDMLRDLAWCDATLAKRVRNVSERIVEGPVEVLEVKPAEAPLLSPDVPEKESQ